MLRSTNSHMCFGSFTRTILRTIDIVDRILNRFACKWRNKVDRVFALPRNRLFIHFVVIGEGINHPILTTSLNILTCSKRPNTTNKLTHNTIVIGIACHTLNDCSCLHRLNAETLFKNLNIISKNLNLRLGA